MPIDPFELDRIADEEGLTAVGADESPPLCVGCGYNLTGLRNRRCPECGRPFNQREIRRHMIDMRFQATALRSMNDWIRFGCWSAVLGVVLLFVRFIMPATTVGNLFAGLLRVGSIIVGAIAFCLGLSVSRIHRLPAAARDQLAIRPNYLAALAAIGTGSGLILFCILGP